MSEPLLKRILVAEDEEDLREIARMALETFGKFTVKMCVSGNDAIAQAPGFKPDLILLDVMMPGLTGPATLTLLRKNPALVAVPVIFCTARAQKHEIKEYLALGAVEVITKPYDPIRLAERIREIWKGITFP